VVNFPEDLLNSDTRLMFGGCIFANVPNWEGSKLAVRDLSGRSKDGDVYSSSSQAVMTPSSEADSITKQLEAGLAEYLRQIGMEDTIVVLGVDAGFKAYAECLIVDDSKTWFRRWCNFLNSTFGLVKKYRGKITLLGKTWNLVIYDSKTIPGSDQKIAFV
jgi:hypothetical protein